MRAIVFTGAGGPEVARLEERPDPVPGPEDVVVRAAFAGLNPADLAQRAGRYPAPAGSPPDVPGLEVGGVVESAGERVTSWRVGDRVFGLVGGGGLSDRVLVHERCVARVPDRLDDREAAAVPEAFVTAHDAIRQADLRPGETLLVHGAAGGVGTAAVQIGVAAGARVVAVVRADHAVAPLAELGAEVMREDAFPSGVGHPVDVILELVGASHFPANLDVIADEGRIVIVSVASGSDVTIPLLTLMRRRIAVRGTALRTRPLEQKAAAIRAFEREVVPALADGRVRPFVDSVFPAERFEDAFGRLAASGKLGKVLLDFGGGA